MRLLLISLFIVFSQIALADIVCTDGSQLVGMAPPKGNERYCALPGGTRHGIYQHWYANGQLMEELHFHHGKEHGLQTAWWPNGKMMMRGESVYGKRYQAFKHWNIQGEPISLKVKIIKEELP